MRIMKQEARRLVKVRVLWDGGTGWTFNLPKGHKIFHGSIEALARFLKKLKATDVETTPKTAQNKRFIDMAREIQTGKDTHIWIWSNILNKLKGTVFGSMSKKKQEKQLGRGHEVNVPYKGRMVSGKVIRYDKGDMHGSPFYVVDVGEYESLTIPAYKIETSGSGYPDNELYGSNDRNDDTYWEKTMEKIDVIEDFQLPGTEITLEAGDQFVLQIPQEEKASAKTAKCPECGTKYLVATGYCLKCKKKVAEPKKEKASAKTAKCPKCGTKYLVATGYCLKCKKKVAEPKSEDSIKEGMGDYSFSVCTKQDCYDIEVENGDVVGVWDGYNQDITDNYELDRELANKVYDKLRDPYRRESIKREDIWDDIMKKVRAGENLTPDEEEMVKKNLKKTGDKADKKKKEAGPPSVRYMYTMANQDHMRTAKKVVVDRDGLVTNVNGKAIDSTPIEDYGDYYLSDKPVTNAFDLWGRRVESQLKEALKPEEFERLYNIFVGTLESEGVLIDERRSEMSNTKAKIALDSPEELDLVYDEVIAIFQQNERNAKKLKIKWDQENLAQYINVTG